MKGCDIGHDLYLLEESVTEGSHSGVGKHSRICEHTFRFIMWNMRDQGYLFSVWSFVRYNLSASLYQEWWLWMSCTCWETLIEDICWNSF